MADPVCVSIFLQTHRAGRQEIRRNPIRLKNLIKQAESLLLNLGQRPASFRKLPAPARELGDMAKFALCLPDRVSALTNRNGHDGLKWVLARSAFKQA